MSQFPIAETFNSGDSIVGLIGGENKRLDATKFLNINEEKTLKNLIDLENGTPNWEVPLIEDYDVKLKGIFNRSSENIEADFGMGLSTNTLDVDSFIGLKILDSDVSSPNAFAPFEYFYQALFNEDGVPLYIFLLMKEGENSTTYIYNNFEGNHYLATKYQIENQPQDEYTKTRVDFQGVFTNISPTAITQRVQNSYSFNIHTLTVSDTFITIGLYGWNGDNTHNWEVEDLSGNPIPATVTPNPSDLRDCTIVIVTSALANNDVHTIKIINNSSAINGKLLYQNIVLRKTTVNDRVTFQKMGRFTSNTSNSTNWIKGEYSTEVNGGSAIAHQVSLFLLDSYLNTQADNTLIFEQKNIPSAIEQCVQFPTYNEGGNEAFTRQFDVLSFEELNDGVGVVDNELLKKIVSLDFIIN